MDGTTSRCRPGQAWFWRPRRAAGARRV
jgi:hypothetical protein